MAQPVTFADLTSASLSAGAALAVFQDGDSFRTTPRAIITEAASYTPPGAGAVAEPVQAALRRSVHTTQYGNQAQYEAARDALTGTIGVHALQVASSLSVSGAAAFAGTAAFAGAAAFADVEISGSLVLPRSASPNQTAEGSIAWDTDDSLVVGTGSGRKTLVDTDSTQTISAKTINLANNTVTGTIAEFNAAVSDGDFVVLASGTAMLFAQTAAPTGWTKSTSHNDKALRVVSGTASSGGATAFTSVFGSGKTAGSTTLTTSHLPASGLSIPSLSLSGSASGGSLTMIVGGGGGGTGHDAASRSSNPVDEQITSQSLTGFSASVSGTTGTGTTGNMGTGGSHNHTLSLDLQYVDVIMATKD